MTYTWSDDVLSVQHLLSDLPSVEMIGLNDARDVLGVESLDMLESPQLASWGEAVKTLE